MTEKDGCVVIAEAELENDTISVLKNTKIGKWYHVFKNNENVQPNHDSEGVMRYLMHIIQNLGHSVAKLKKEKETLEKRNELLVKLLDRVRTDGPDVDLITSEGDWTILLPYLGGYKVNNQKKGLKWENQKTLKEVLDMMFAELEA